MIIIIATYLLDLIQRDRCIEPASPNVQVGEYFLVYGVPVGVRYSRQTIHRWHYHIIFFLFLNEAEAQNTL